MPQVRNPRSRAERQQEAVDHSKKYLDPGGRHATTPGSIRTSTWRPRNPPCTVNEESLAALQIEQMTASVELIQALGGGWDTTQLPTPAQVTAKPARADTTILH